MKISSRSAVDPFIVMDVMQQAADREAKGRSIIHMEVGQPGTGAPQIAKDAVAAQMQDDPLGYTVALGRPDLRVRIAKLYMDWYGVDLSPDRIVITAGSSAAFQLAFISLFDAGDKVAIGDPGYPSYRNILKALSLNPIGLETSVDNRFQPSPSELSTDLDGLLVASPANPTGTMLDHAHLKALIDACHANEIAFISDEIYHGIQYKDRAISALEISDDVYVINSFSKYFSMTGWRIGWMVVPQTHIRRVERLAQNMFICAPHIAQIAALHAMDADAELSENMAVYTQNRQVMLDELPSCGFDKIAPPDGAFYIYADVSDMTNDSRTLARDILLNAGVAVTPGLDFDPLRGHQTLRFSYARSTADIKEGLKRLKSYMETK